MMADEKNSTLRKLAVKVDALRRAMDAVMSGTTPDHGKWGAFKSYAGAYNTLAAEYNGVTGERNVRTYNLDKIRASTVWPAQKTIFDTVYADTLMLSGLLNAYDVGISASISKIQDLLVGLYPVRLTPA